MANPFNMHMAPFDPDMDVGVNAARHHHHHHHQLFKHGSPFSKAGLQGAMHLKYYKNFKRANNNESRLGKRT